LYNMIISLHNQYLRHKLAWSLSGIYGFMVFNATFFFGCSF
jgi:lipid-A-disaccharide synthase-like uncharacterized protein